MHYTNDKGDVVLLSQPPVSKQPSKCCDVAMHRVSKHRLRAVEESLPKAVEAKGFRLGCLMQGTGT
jgi:hypothetical protein